MYTGSESLNRTNFCKRQGKSADNTVVLSSILTQYFHKFVCLNHIVFDSRVPNQKQGKPCFCSVCPFCTILLPPLNGRDARGIGKKRFRTLKRNPSSQLAFYAQILSLPKSSLLCGCSSSKKSEIFPIFTPVRVRRKEGAASRCLREVPFECSKKVYIEKSIL